MHTQNPGSLARRWWWLILLTSLVLGGLGAWQQLSKPTQYASKVTLYMTSGRAQNVQVSQTSNLAVQQLASYAKLVGTDKLAVELAKDAKVDVKATRLADGMQVALVKDTVLMNVTTTLPNKADAQAVSQALPVTMTRVARQLGGDLAAGDLKVTFTTVDGPSTGSTRSLPKLLLSTLVGLLLGAALGYGLAMALGRLGRGLRNPDDLRDAAGVPVLGVLPRTKDTTDPRADADRWNGLRRLATNIANPRANRRVVTVSGVDQDASGVAAGLAAALADSGRRVLLMSPAGATAAHPGLDVLGTDSLPTGPAAWRSWRADAPLDTYDLVVIDGDSVLGSPDASANLAADTTVLVGRQRATDRAAVASARQSLVAAGTEEIVAVLDDVDPRDLAHHAAASGVSFVEESQGLPTRATH